MKKYGREFGAELLMATDPDSDRFAIEIRDNDGNYVPLNGNQTGYLLVNYILEGHESAGTLPKKGAMVKSIVTSTLSTKMAKAYGVEMFETLTGFKISVARFLIFMRMAIHICLAMKKVLVMLDAKISVIRMVFLQVCL